MIFVLILHVIVSLVLIVVILLQAGKGGGLSEAFGGASQQIFGTKSSAFLNRATAVCAVLFLITCLSLGILAGRGRKSLLEDVKTEAPKELPVQAQEAPAADAEETPRPTAP
jgi:preprotein translocase subunit SecG